MPGAALLIAEAVLKCLVAGWIGWSFGALLVGPEL